MARSRYSCTQPSAPGSNASPASTMTLQPTSDVPVCSNISAPWRSARGAEASTRTCASMRRVDCSVLGGASTSPRASSLFSTPITFAATRLPGAAVSTLALCRCKPRTRTRRPLGTASSSAPTLRLPSTSVPVTTVPKPLIVNTLSMGRRGRPRSVRGSAPSRRPSSAAFSSLSPRPVTADTGSTTAPSKVVPSRVSRTSASTSSSHGSSTRSAFVSTTTPRRKSRRSSISRCSRV